MRWHITKLTLMDEIRNYFGTRSWKLDATSDELTSFHDERDIKVKVNKDKVKFKVIAEAKDDPSDRLEVVTDNPLKELTDFLSKGLPGGVFESYASNPVLFSKIIRRAATKVRQLGPTRIANFIKQAVLVLSFDSLQEFVSMAIKIAADGYEEIEVFDLFEKMKKKGWDVEEIKTESGRAGIRADFHDLYDIIIEPESIEYEYEYMIEGYPESMAWGTVEDPIRAFEDWIKSDRFQKSSEERETEKKSGGEENVGETVAPEKTKKRVDEKETKAPPSRITPEAFAPTVPSQRRP
jgi:hypothetical protein